ncbi:SDR family oxidoreductase [Streptomonospora wellingtoniae]|uniref:NAD(P)H-binding protein n=1 Tax=Streptomonospora wellingtoniae TaxID=3075544 RepID=A0ABU2L116_9ACTN|nr:NAD(P)H-binding protein [Streptomonospora sp. DSM 45055]MDT0305251.1 NAD(P)H-binding protein [Streptomonospora sp. DSM 45055]
MANNPTPILITGGTGTLGRRIVRRLADDDDTEVRVLSRRAAPTQGDGARWITGDLASDQGLDQALTGVDTVVHCAHVAGSSLGEVSAGANVITAAARAGVRHFIYISIVGIDYVPLSYYKGKLAVEELIEESGLPSTILRATQFHELIDWLLGQPERLPVVPVPAGFWFQPVAADEVAGRLVDIAREGPGGRAVDMGGPEVRSVESLATSYESIRGRSRPVKKIPFPGEVARAFRSGANLAAGNADGRQTWEEYLSAAVEGPGE